MSIEYDFYRNPNPQGNNKKRYHARVVSSNRISTDELAEEIQNNSILCICRTMNITLVLQKNDNVTPPVQQIFLELHGVRNLLHGWQILVKFPRN